ncbi:MAG TPA: dicarboxylate/amino acid:cation symporter [Chthoniobacterales bacterium]|nr:dicarboxylate/amino acid:cation symporter [Chthoniobacterales bacterium]
MATGTNKAGFFGWWNRTPLYQRILGGLVLGVITGEILSWCKGTPADPNVPVMEVLAGLAIFSKLVLRLLGALAPALILFAIMQALIRAAFEPGTAPRLVRLLLLNTLVAICVGLLVANVVRPGHWEHLDRPTADPHLPQADILQQLLDNVPQSLLGPLGDNGKVIGVIFIAIAFGLALRRSPKKESIAQWVDVGLDTLIIILHWIIAIVPLAVFGLVASIIGTKGFGAFQALFIFVLAVILALLIQASYYLIRIRLCSWVRPMQLLRGGRDALIMAFSTGSSTATMPVTFECLKDRVGLREKSASLGALLGSNFNNDGTALYEAMAALFISQMVGIELSFPQQLMVVITSVVASVGAAGIPEAGLVTMTLVFHAVGLDPVYIALLLPVDWFLDRCRTAINVMGDMNVSCLLDGRTPQDPAFAAGR